jgi:hypothetical protein
MSNIPLARTRLSVIAADLRRKGCFTEAREIGVIITDLLIREKAIRRAPVRSKSVTPAIKAHIKALAAAHRSMSMDEIGRRAGVDGGRVSEVLNGKR